MGKKESNIDGPQTRPVDSEKDGTTKIEAGFYGPLRKEQKSYNVQEVTELLAEINEERLTTLAEYVAQYISVNVPRAVNRRSGLVDYRINPYVLFTSASLMNLSDTKRFADFLFNSKLYAGLETSFGKSIESIFLGLYPLEYEPECKWQEPPEKIAESQALAGLSREDKASRRKVSVWREIDRSCVINDRRFLVTVKSGPNCINDTQVSEMRAAIATHHKAWMERTRQNYPDVTQLDVVIGLTYGTDRTTNNKENQILVKLLGDGFEEEDRNNKPGVLIDSETHRIRVYRTIGQDFWSFIGDPTNPDNAKFVFLEVLVALAKALAECKKQFSLEERINVKLAELAQAFLGLIFPRNSLPEWVREDFSEDELFWLATAISSFYDEGI